MIDEGRREGAVVVEVYCVEVASDIVPKQMHSYDCIYLYLRPSFRGKCLMNIRGRWRHRLRDM